MKHPSRKILAVWAIGLVSASLFCHQAQAQGPITGNITWGGSVELNTSSAATASMVTAWHGTSTTPISGAPKVESVDGSLATFVNVGDGTLFHAPWSFNTSTPITGFWSVDGFTFDLTASSIPPGGQGGTPGTTGFVTALGTGTVSGHGFTPTAGTWRFSTQDPGAGTPQEFSFSAATSVPEGSTVTLMALGGVGLLLSRVLRRKFGAA
jgi:hypothetical protein